MASLPPAPRRQPRGLTILDLLSRLPAPAEQPVVEAVPESAVREGFGLQGAQISGYRSPYAPTFGPDEQPTVEDVRSALWAIVDAAGMDAIKAPGISGRRGELQRPARMRPGHEREFIEWYGETQLVDHNGEPLTFYHGTGSENPIQSFKAGKAFFTTSKGRANDYAISPGNADRGLEPDGAVYPVHLKMERPYIVRDEGSIDSWRMPGGFERLREMGYDGIMTRPNRSTGEVVAMPLGPEQIKSATGNRGTYRRDSADIRE